MACRCLQDCYQLGQVVRCRVVLYDSVRHKLKLSLSGKSAEAEATPVSDALGGLQPGDLVQGTVTQVQDSNGQKVFSIDVSGRHGGRVSGRLEEAHLGDHPAAVEALRDVLAAGARLSGLLVLERLEGAKQARTQGSQHSG